MSVSVNGLFGTGLVLENNGGNPLAVSANGAATFSTSLATGTAYNVAVRTQPTSSPAQTCTVSAGAGTVASANVAGIAVSCRAQAGHFLYVPVAGTVNAVAGFTIDASNGALTPIAGSPFATPVQTQAPRVLYRDPSGKFLYVYGDNDVSTAGQTTLTGFTVNAQTGALTPIPGPVTLNASVPSPLVFHPSGNFVYAMVSDATQTVNNTLRGFAIVPTTGELIAMPAAVWGPIAANEVLNSAVMSPNGSSIYLSSVQPAASPNAPVGRVTQIAVNAQGEFLPQPAYVVTIGAMTFYQFFMHPAGTHMYSRNGGPAGLLTSRFALDATTGAIGIRQDFPTAFGLGAVIAPNSRVYFLELGGVLPPGAPAPGSVVGYVDSASGAASALPGARWPTGGDNPLSVTLDPTGRFIAMTNTGTQKTVTVMKIDPASGSLTSVAGSPFLPYGGTLPGSVVFDPSARFAYLADGSGNGSISSYAIDVDTGVPTFADSEPLLGAPGVSQPVIFGRQ